MEDFGIIRVIDVEYLHDYLMKLQFNNGEYRIIDFEPFLHGKFYDELREKQNFIRFGLTPWTLEWYNGVDFAPQFLYEHSTTIYEQDSNASSCVAENATKYNASDGKR